MTNEFVDALTKIEADFFHKEPMYKATPPMPMAAIQIKDGKPVTYPNPAKTLLTTDKAARKNQPVARGVLDYFPLAIAEIANVSYVGNQQHNPGEPMHWARGKSNDHADCVVRHLMERGTVDEDGLRHSAKAAWRALALLQEELEGARK